MQDGEALSWVQIVRSWASAVAAMMTSIAGRGTFVLSKMWGLNTEPALQALAAFAPPGTLKFKRVD